MIYSPFEWFTGCAHADNCVSKTVKGWNGTECERTSCDIECGAEEQLCDAGYNMDGKFYFKLCLSCINIALENTQVAPCLWNVSPWKIPTWIQQQWKLWNVGLAVLRYVDWIRWLALGYLTVKICNETLKDYELPFSTCHLQVAWRILTVCQRQCRDTMGKSVNVCLAMPHVVRKRNSAMQDMIWTVTFVVTDWTKFWKNNPCNTQVAPWLRCVSPRKIPTWIQQPWKLWNVGLAVLRYVNWIWWLALGYLTVKICYETY